jgi:hypothetical protein
MHIIGQPKSIDELELLTIEDLRGMAKFLDKEIRSGTPVDMPQAMTLRDLGRLFRSAIAFYEEAEKLKTPQPDAPQQVGRLFIPPLPKEST